jgi:hypothetical protein
MAKKKRKWSKKKMVVPYILNPKASDRKIIFFDRAHLFEHIEGRILDVIEVGEEVTVKIGLTKMTEKQMDSLPDIDE